MASRALVVSDGKPGHENQSTALCRLLGFDYDVVSLTFRNRACKLLSHLFDAAGFLWGGLVDQAPLPGSAYDAVVAAGSETYYGAKRLGRLLDCPTIAILAPRGYRLDFSAVVVPEHDRFVSAPNVIRVPVNLCRSDSAFFTCAAAAFAERHTQHRPAVGFVIGGDNRVFHFSSERLESRIREVMAQSQGREFWVTTSRRTGPEIESMLERLPFEYRLLYSTDSYNPVPAFIALCERLVVTADSTSMISEAVCYGSAAVEVLMPDRQTGRPGKFLRLIEGLEDRGALHVYDGSLGSATAKIDLQSHAEKVRTCISSK